MRTGVIDRIDGRPEAVPKDSQPLVWFASFAIAGHIFLLASQWLLPAVSEFTLVGDNISELVLGNFGFIQTAAFFVAGIVTVGLAYALRRLAPDTWGASAGSLLIAVGGLGLIFVSVFPTDRIDTPADVWSSSTIGTIHIIASIVSFLSFIAAMFVLAWTLRRDPRWQLFPVWTAFFAASSLSLFFAQGEGPLVGLLQRLLATAISVWLILAAFRVRSIAALGVRYTHDSVD